MTESALIRGFSFGAVFGGGFNVMFRNFIIFMLISIIFSAPTSLYLIFGTPPMTASDVQTQAIIIVLVEFITATLTTALLTYGTVQTLRGQRASLGSTIANGLAVLLPAIGVALLVGLGIALAAIVAAVPALVVQFELLFVIPVVVALILATMWWVAIPAVVIERNGVVAAIGRSRELTKGYRWPIFGIILITGVLGWLVDYVLQKIFFGMAGRGMVDPLYYFLANWAAVAFFGALTSVMAAVAYFALRADKDGADIGQLATVFD